MNAKKKKRFTLKPFEFTKPYVQIFYSSFYFLTHNRKIRNVYFFFLELILKSSWAYITDWVRNNTKKQRDSSPSSRLPFFIYSLEFRTQNWIFFNKTRWSHCKKENNKKIRLCNVYEYILLFLDLSLNNLWTKSIVVTKNFLILKNCYN